MSIFLTNQGKYLSSNGDSGNDEGGFYSTHFEEKILYKKPLDKIKAPSVVDIEGTTLHWAEVELHLLTKSLLAIMKRLSKN